MSAVIRSSSIGASKTSSTTGRDSQISRKKSLTGEVYHRVSRWYPSISDIPKETIILTVNGGPTGQIVGGKAKADGRNESRVGTSSTINESDHHPEPQTPKSDHKTDKISRTLNVKQDHKE